MVEQLWTNPPSQRPEADRRVQTSFGPHQTPAFHRIKFRVVASESFPFEGKNSLFVDIYPWFTSVSMYLLSIFLRRSAVSTSALGGPCVPKSSLRKIYNHGSQTSWTGVRHLWNPRPTRDLAIWSRTQGLHGITCTSWGDDFRFRKWFVYPAKCTVTKSNLPGWVHDNKHKG